MSPETVNTSGVVGQATSFDLTLTGGSPYTYTQTFGNICDVSINNDTATVTITPTTSGTLTGSITFNEEATCNITIDVSEPEPPSVVTVTPNTVSENGIVGQATSFNLTLSGGTTYTYTQTFGNICSVAINENIATVTITPTETGTLTGSITFNEEATCNITITVSEPTPPPTGGFDPSSMNVSLARADSKTCYFELLSGSYDSSTETVDFGYTITSTSTDPLIDFENELNIREDIKTPPEYQLILESNNESGEILTGDVNVYAKIFDGDTFELLRTYTATINVKLFA